MSQFQIKCIGNHWYPCFPHDNPNDLQLDEVIERYLTMFARYNNVNEINIELEEIPIIIEDSNVVYFEESDITRYYTTSDCFDLRFEINGHELFISDYLFTCLIDHLNVSLHSSLYRLHIW